MDCNQVQQYFNGLISMQESKSVSSKINQHLIDCTDCRVQQQRIVRLQQLLALKRYEKPHPEYFDCFLSEFRQRLYEEQTRQPSLWQQMTERFREFTFSAIHFRYAGGIAILIALACMWAGLQVMNTSSKPSNETPIFQKTVRKNTTDHLPNAFPQLTSFSKQINGGDQFHSVEFVSQRPEEEVANTTEYILESITITPVNYEVDSVHF